MIEIDGNPAQDALRIVEAIQHNPSWDSVYSRLSSRYKETRKIHLDKAIEAIAVSKGLDGQMILAGLAKVPEMHENERRSLGSEVRVGDQVVGSTQEGSTVEAYDEFANKKTGSHQAPGFEVGQTGTMGEGSLSRGYVSEALNRIDNFFGSE